MLDTSLFGCGKVSSENSVILWFAHLDPEAPPTRVAYASGPEQIIKDFPADRVLQVDRWYRPLLLEYKTLPLSGTPRSLPLTLQVVVLTRQPTVWWGHYGKQNCFLLEAGGYHGGYEEEAVLKAPSVRSPNTGNVDRILVESNFGDGMFQQILKPVLK